MVWGARESGPAMVLLGPQLTVSSIGGERALQPPLKERARARACCVSEGVVAGGVSKFWCKNKTVEGEAADSVGCARG